MPPNHNGDTVSGIIWATLEAAQRGRTTIWTIYDRPRDHPDGFIARRFEIGSGSTTPTKDTLTGKVDDLRYALERAGFVKITRSEGDEAPIVESWI
jgi:hypothetical protein